MKLLKITVIKQTKLKGIKANDLDTVFKHFIRLNIRSIVPLSSVQCPLLSGDFHFQTLQLSYVLLIHDMIDMYYDDQI